MPPSRSLTTTTMLLLASTARRGQALLAPPSRLPGTRPGGRRRPLSTKAPPRRLHASPPDRSGFVTTQYGNYEITQPRSLAADKPRRYTGAPTPAGPAPPAARPPPPPPPPPPAAARAAPARARTTAAAAPPPQLSEPPPPSTPLSIDLVHCVRDAASARVAVAALQAHGARGLYCAVDTEVADIDLKTVGPVGNGFVTCISVFAGPDVDFGSGPGKALWVDNLDDADGVLMEFKAWLEDETCLKVWHNYGFDRHVLHNHGIDCRGFGGDTMHMARAWDSNRDKRAGAGGYGLEALTGEILGRRKAPMKEIFGVPRLLKSGAPSAVKDLPNVRTLQQDPAHRQKWIEYSAYDAEGTYLLFEALRRNLENMVWEAPAATAAARKLNPDRTMWDLYREYVVPFGKVLTDMERIGIEVDRDGHLKQAEAQARKDLILKEKLWRDWACSVGGPDMLHMNPSSGTQIQAFLFGGSANQKDTGQCLPSERSFDIPLGEVEAESQAGAEKQAAADALSAMPTIPEDALVGMKVADLKEACKARLLKIGGSKKELQDRLRDAMNARAQAVASGADVPAKAALEDEYSTMSDADLRDACVARGLSAPADAPGAALAKLLREDAEYARALFLEQAAAASTVAKTKKRRTREISIHTLGLRPEKFTASGWAATDASVLRRLAGQPSDEFPTFGPAYEHFGGGEEGEAACMALDALCQMGSIETMISSFLLPLQFLADDNNRVHCSLNLNTETGRLSSRRPNLQNQPALEKDVYKIRNAFQASEGNTLIVADYGQLELRLLAHMAKCTSMLDAFKTGGDFHSKTAVGMFPHVRQAVEDGDVLLDWDRNDGEAPAPLLKDKFGSERRKAKTLNFSIAYGKTVHGLSKDWGVSVAEAQEILERWYADRPEVQAWQKKTIANARKHGNTRTLMGRYRNLPGAQSSDRRLRGHAERAAINTPIQGGAADVVMMAMIKLDRSEILKRLGWKQLLQIHDEVILEGPKKDVEEALAEVRNCMERPYDDEGLAELLVTLEVDAKYADTWYEAK